MSCCTFRAMRQFITKFLNTAVLCMRPIRGSSLLVLVVPPFQYRPCHILQVLHTSIVPSSLVISGASLLPPLNHRTFLLSTTDPSLSQYRSFRLTPSLLHPLRASFLSTSLGARVVPSARLSRKLHDSSVGEEFYYVVKYTGPTRKQG
jgi:hypothetical protein